MAAPHLPRAGPRPAGADRDRPNWVLTSLLAGIAMAVLLMLVATLLRKGFLTPLYLVAAPFIGPDEATTSMAAADAGADQVRQHGHSHLRLPDRPARLEVYRIHILLRPPYRSSPRRWPAIDSSRTTSALRLR